MVEKNNETSFMEKIRAELAKNEEKIRDDKAIWSFIENIMRAELKDDPAAIAQLTLDIQGTLSRNELIRVLEIIASEKVLPPSRNKISGTLENTEQKENEQ